MINKSSPVQVQGLTNSFAQTPNLVSSSWSQLSVGEGYNIAIKQDGTMWSWGRNDYGQLGLNNGTLLRVSSPVQIGTSYWNSVSAGLNSSLAIRSDGLMFQWGLNNNNQLVGFDQASYWSRMAAGRYHTVAIKHDGSLWTWGYNQYGQIGDGTIITRLSPVQINAGSWIKVAATAYDSFAIRSDNTLWAWGLNNFGELGQSNTISYSSPVQIAGSWSTVSAFSQANDYPTVLGIKTDGKIFGWGYNANGQIGDGTTVTKSSPVLVAGLAATVSFIDVSANDHTLAIDSANRLWAWGQNNWGQQGDGAFISKSSPTQINTGVLFSSVSAGISYSVALSVDKKLYTWGYNGLGQLGSNTAISYSSPVQIGTSSWTSVTAGSFASAGVDINGRLFTWGWSNAGQLGLNNVIINYSSPVQVGTSSYTNVIATSSHNRYYLAYSTINGLWFASGQDSGSTYSGNPTNIIANNSSPVQIGTLPIIVSPTQIGTSSWTSVSSGYSHSVALRSDNTIWAWGRNNLGQLGSDALSLIYDSPIQITSTSDYTAVAAGNDYTIAKKSDGTVYVWGLNNYGQLGISTPAQTTYSYRSLGAGGYSFYSIRDDYKLFTWGSNTYGELGTNDTIFRSSPVQVGNDSWTSVTGGYYFTAGIKTDGTLWTWGLGSTGQLGNGFALSRSSPVQVPGSWSQVSLGYSTAVGLKTDGTLWGWGLAQSIPGTLFGSGINQSSPVQITNRSWTQVGIGFSHAIALDTTGTVWTWGLNNVGQLGDNSTVNKNAPTILTTTKSFTYVFATQWESYALDTNGILYGWGLNTQQGFSWTLGDGTSITRSSPVQIGTKRWKRVINSNGYGILTSGNDNPTTLFIDENDYVYGIGGLFGSATPTWAGGLSNFSYAQIASGDSTSAILRTDGRLFAFGLNNVGQLGDNSTTSRTSPTQVGLNATVTEGEMWRNVQLPRSASVAIRGDYKLYSWGSNNWNVLGTDDATTTTRSSPVQISSLNKSWAQISSHYSHAIGLTTDGMMYGWGTNTFNAVGFITSWTQISAGASNALFLRSDGTLYATGGNTTGAIGNNTTINKSSPVQVSSEKFIRIAAGVSNTNFAINSSYKLFAWGTNSGGQLGDGTTINRSSPVQIGTSSWLTLTSTPNTTLAIRGDNTLWAWGQNESNIFGSATVADYYSSPVQIGTSSWTNISADRDLATVNPHALGIDVNNKLYGWGFNGNGELGLGYVSATQSWINLASGYNSYAVRNDGTLWTWGADTTLYGSLVPSSTSYRSSPVQVTALNKSVSQIAASASTVFVIATDNTMYGWGNNLYGYLGIDVSWRSIAYGNQFTVGVRSDGTMWSWGNNLNGQLGIGDVTNRSNPVQIGSLSNWSTVSTGISNQSVTAINNLGQLYAWGANGSGQLGDGTILARSSPVQIGTAFSWTNVLTTNFSLGLTTTGLLFTWGINQSGQLGLNDIVSRSSPVQISGDNFTQIAQAINGPNAAHALAVRSDGKLFAWGGNTWGQLGNNTIIDRSSPTQIGTSNWSRVSATQSTSAAIDANGMLYTWGSTSVTLGAQTTVGSRVVVSGYRTYMINSEGNLFTVGYGADALQGLNSVGNRSYPVQIGNKSYRLVDSLQNTNAVATDTDYKLFTWGSNTAGQVGDGTTINRSSPVQIGNDSWTIATTNGISSFAIKSDGTLWAWGGNGTQSGGLGLNDTVHRSSPVQIGTSSWTTVSTGQSGTFATTGAAIDINGQLFTWGYNLQGQLGDGTTVNKSSPVQVAGSWNSVSVGGLFMLGLKSDNTLWGWGSGLNGTLGNSLTVNRSSPIQIGTSNWFMISAGQYTAHAITQDRKLFSWGKNNLGQLGLSDLVSRSSPVQIGTSSWTFVEASGDTDLSYGGGAAIDINNRVFIWGNNTFGQLGNSTVTSLSSPIMLGSPPSRSSPVQVSSKSWTQVSIGLSAVALIDNTNKLFMWGTNASGELFLGDTITRSFAVPVQSATNFSSVVVANAFTYAMRSDNTVIGAGLNTSWALTEAVTDVARSSPVQLSGTRFLLPAQFTGSWTSVSAWSSFAVAVRSDGTLWSSGINSTGVLGMNQPVLLGNQAFTRVGNLSNWASVHAGPNFVVARKTDGTIWAWGENGQGQLGQTDIIVRSSPVQIGTSSWTKVQTANGFTNAIRSDGTLWGWGDGGRGGIAGGNNGFLSINNQSSPIQIGTSSWTNIASTFGGMLAVRLDGTMWGWGRNTNGELGVGSIQDRSSPTQIGASTGWTLVNAIVMDLFTSSSSALLNGVLYVWGSNSSPQHSLADGTNVGKSTPILLAPTINYFPITQIGNSSWTQIASGAGHSLAIDSNSRLFAWGLNNVGQLGLTTIVSRSSPVQIGTSSYVAVTAGVSISAAIDTTSKLYTWGLNTVGQLGQNDTVNRSSPVQLGTSSYIAVSSQTSTTVAVDSAYRLFAWGSNTVGQVSDNTTINRSSPVQIATTTSTSVFLPNIISESSFSQVSAGQDFSIAIKGDGTLWGWGLNYHGQAVPQSRPVLQSFDGGSVGKFIILDNRLYGQGSNPQGQVGINSVIAQSVFTAIPGSWSKIGGNQGISGIRTDGTLWVWGFQNSYGILGLGDSINRSSPVQLGTSNNWIYTNGGLQTNSFINSNNQLYMVGRNEIGLLGDGTTINRSSPVQVAGSWTSIAHGLSHTLGIRTNGTLWSWGNNSSGQLGMPEWIDAEAGTNFTIAIRSDGTLWTWGINSNGRLGLGDTVARSSAVQVGTDANWIKVAAGGSHAMALKSDYTLWAFGQNTSGQLGDNTNIPRSSPVQVQTAGKSVVTIFARNLTSGFITSDSRLFLFGDGNSGGIGQNTASVVNYSSPVQVPGSWSTMAMGNYSMAGIQTDGTLWVWGANSLGELGIGLTTARSSPVQIGVGNSWISVAAGNSHKIAVDSNKRIWGWGANNLGQVGDATTVGKSSPVQIPFAGLFTNVYATGGTSYGVSDASGLLFSWGTGLGGYSASTDGVTTRSSPMVANAATSYRFTKISGDVAGTDKVVGLTSTNNLYWWAQQGGTPGLTGDLANPTGNITTPSLLPSMLSRSSPAQVGTKSNWTKIDAGTTHSVALDSNGLVYTWGGNSGGELGDGTTISKSAPQVVFSGAVDIAAVITSNTYALRKDGTMWGSGFNNAGQIGDNTTIYRSNFVQVGGNQNLYFKAIGGGYSSDVFGIDIDNTLWAWGNNPEGSGAPIINRSNPVQVGISNAFTTISSPVQITSGSWSKISAGASHAFAIKSDGTLYGWGSNYLGRVGSVDYNSSSSNIMPIAAAGSDYTTGLILNDGTLWMAGVNGQGQVGDNTVAAKSSPVQVPGSWISVGVGTEYLSTIAVRSDYTLWAWGQNTSNRLGTVDVTPFNRSNPVQIMPTVSWSQVALNNLTNYAISTDGKLFTWGASSSPDLGRSFGLASVPTQIMSGTSFSQVAAGYSNGFAITTDNRLFAWGFNGSGGLGLGDVVSRSSPVQVPGSWTYISTWSYGGYGPSSVAIKTDGTVWGWGVNNYGKLGQNDTINRSSPVQIATGNSWINAATTDYNTYLIDSSYNLYGVGFGSYMNSAVSYSVSSPVQIGTSWHKVFAPGQSQSFMVNRDGSLWVMGVNTNGALGTNNITAANALTKPVVGLYKLNDYNVSAFSSPVQISTLATSWIAVSAGLSHSAGVSSTNELYTWGAGTNGQIGDNMTQNRNAPTKISTSSWNNVDAGFENTIASLVNGNVFAWGLGTQGQIGNSSGTSRSSPTQTTTGSYTSTIQEPFIPYALTGIQVKDAATSSYSKLLIRKDDNQLYSFAGGQYGLLGTNNSAAVSNVSVVRNTIQLSVNNPTQLSGSYSLVAAGKQHALSTKSDGTLYTWGSYQNATTLKQAYKQVYNGYDSGTYALIRGDDTLWMWGYNTSGVLGQNDTIFRSSPVQVPGSWSTIAITSSHIVAIKTDGSLWSWGGNNAGQLGLNDIIYRSSPVQIGTSSWSMVSANYAYHTKAIDINGRLFAWGINGGGLLGDGTTVNKSSPVQIGSSSWTYVASAYATTVGITADNFLFGWGLNTHGQIGDGTVIPRSSPVQIGTAKYKKVVIAQTDFTPTYALRSDGTLFGYGYNAQYQVGDGTSINRSSPVQIGTAKFKDLATYFVSTMSAIGIDNQVYTWGSGTTNYFTATTQSVPTVVNLNTPPYGRIPLTAKVINHNNTNTLYIGLDDIAYGVGLDTNGGLAYYGTQAQTSSPVQIGVYGTSSPVQLNSGTWTNLSAGNETSAGISNEALYFWGKNNNYQSGINTTSQQISSPTVVIASKAVSAGTNTNNTGGISNS